MIRYLVFSDTRNVGLAVETKRVIPVDVWLFWFRTDAEAMKKKLLLLKPSLN